MKDPAYPEHCSIGEALKILLDEFGRARTKTVTVKPEDALCLVLASDVSSMRNVPHYTASAVDGYAVIAGDTAGAAPSAPVLLEPGNFSWVNTGMPIGGANSVAMVEDTSSDKEGLKIFKNLTQGENVRAVGEDVMNRQLLACRGDLATPALISLFLCAGVENIQVYAKPRTIFIPTGNEIVSKERWLSGEKIQPGFVADSNSAYASALFSSWGYELDVAPIMPDDPDVIAEAVNRASCGYDLVIVSAGSAKGSRDHSAGIFSTLGKMLFRYVRMKPGRPAMAANIGGTPVICSPGFPMSCAVTLWSFAYPLLKTLSGEPFPPDHIPDAIGSRKTLEAAFMTQHSSPPGVAEWLRVKCADVGGNTLCWP
ncbi:MAG: molybdopterin molybdotransferase MoeA, partial [Synergistaceae bacterium]|nr:molybdopterin molybdotransferase MoeA [Synergistaceae bacterium]